ncbi:MAG: glycine cleavage system protein T [Aggregatilineales bacterium]
MIPAARPLDAVHRRLGAQLAPDGIPLHYGDQAAEFAAGRGAAVLMDRSHEGRLSLSGRDRLDLIQRMSTNDVLALQDGQGCPTIFTNPIGRILDRITVYHRGETALVLTEPGRGEAVRAYLTRNTFFNDEVQIADRAADLCAFALHGPSAAAVVEALGLPSALGERLSCFEITIAGVLVDAAQVKPLFGSGWVLLVPAAAAGAVWSAVLEAGSAHGLRPAGSLTYNALRIAAGRPGVGRELSDSYIPLEVGLWDEVSFTKGCYTGQEIIARMESRGRLARTLVAVTLDGFVEAPAPLRADGREAGTLTSSVLAPDGICYGLGVVRLRYAQPGTTLTVKDRQAYIVRRAGTQPASLIEEA